MAIFSLILIIECRFCKSHCDMCLLRSMVSWTVRLLVGDIFPPKTEWCTKTHTASSVPDVIPFRNTKAHLWYDGLSVTEECIRRPCLRCAHLPTWINEWGNERCQTNKMSWDSDMRKEHVTLRHQSLIFKHTQIRQGKWHPQRSLFMQGKDECAQQECQQAASVGVATPAHTCRCVFHRSCVARRLLPATYSTVERRICACGNCLKGGFLTLAAQQTLNWPPTFGSAPERSFACQVLQTAGNVSPRMPWNLLSPEYDSKVKTPKYTLLYPSWWSTASALKLNVNHNLPLG